MLRKSSATNGSQFKMRMVSGKYQLPKNLLLNLNLIQFAIPLDAQKPNGSSQIKKRESILNTMTLLRNTDMMKISLIPLEMK